ncbi:SDR family NAD(P)-dependent oxidoreductase [Halocynthiibacter namhaensis]|uniref:SDR family NAD(P)-dependent oxidoreductase n=1 Tax=Halocynthiibacter namhaensis TaxID=1290553 RepID=UPI000578F2E0|nr:SDR family NAD(P)-dependent oxidoreductase [Halocynthiibacter namhaensis]
MKLENVIAMVTGGASGLGEACARAIIKAGGKVVAVDMNEQRGADLAVELGDNLIFAQGDVTSEQDIGAALDACEATHGPVNALVNCAGIAIAAKTVGRDGAHPMSSFSKVIDVNLKGTFNTCRLAAERMQHNGADEDGNTGVIVNTASIAAFDGQKGQPAYAASKAGVAGMTLPMARDLASYGIRVNCIAPGLFLTPMLQGLPEEAQEALGKQPLFPKRLGKPSEVADLAVFLISHSYMNGEIIRVDGGIRLP